MKRKYDESSFTVLSDWNGSMFEREDPYIIHFNVLPT